ncbi:MAG: tetratricopeptide repeat protein, partial [Deltaproteobacteria bacterium]|nr:tetratricopeptide repeat protein [Deltaproteobacteria bacterium]
AAATSAQPPSRGGEKPGEGKPVGPVEVGPSLLAETVHLTGTPASDAYINYNHSLEEQKKLVFSPKASDKDRCIFALTAGFFTMRYGQNDALAGEARRALDAAGSSDEISECQLAEVSLALAAGKLDDAVEPVEELLRKDPQNSDAMLLKGEMLIQRKQHAAAAQILRQAMMLRSSQPRLTYALARAQLLDGKVLEGRQRMEEVLQLDEDHPLATMAMAEELRSREKYADAVRILRRMTNEDRPLGPNLLLANAHQLTADMLTRQGKSDDAVRELTQALTRKPGNVEILLELGKLYNQRGQYEQALQQYDSINSLGKPNLDAHIGQIRCLLALRKLSEANEVIIAARREWPENPQLPYYQGIVQEERGAIDKAREEYQNALKQDPHFFYPTIRLARLFLREGKKDEALKAMLKAVKENTKAGVLQDGLGELYITLNDLPRARTAFEKALELDPLLHIARFHLASTLLNLGESQAALEQFLKVQASGNDALEVHYGLARTLQALGQFDQAIEEYNAVLALDEDNDEYSFAAGTAYFEKGEYEKARQRFNQALALNSKLHRAHFLTGLAFLREGNAVQAEKRFRIAVEDFR